MSLLQFIWQLKTCPVTYHHRIEETEVILHQFLTKVNDLIHTSNAISRSKQHVTGASRASKWRGGEENFLAPAWKGTSLIQAVARHFTDRSIAPRIPYTSYNLLNSCKLLGREITHVMKLNFVSFHNFITRRRLPSHFTVYNNIMSILILCDVIV